MVRILGIDPGIASTGWGIIDCYEGRVAHVEHGVISTAGSKGARQTDDMGRRCREIAEGIAALIESYGPDDAALEAIVNFGQNPNIPRMAYIQAGNLSGELRATLHRFGLAAFEYPTQSVKATVAASRKATKTQVGDYVRARLGLAAVPRPDHAADALAVALCHWAKQAAGLGIVARAGGRR